MPLPVTIAQMKADKPKIQWNRPMERPVAGVIQPGFKSQLCHTLAVCDLGQTA